MSVVLGTGCGNGDGTGGDGPSAGPEARAVQITTTGCGLAPDRTGSGVAVGDGIIVTVAHLVARAADITAAVGGGTPSDVTLTAVDLQRDLALLRFEPDGLPPVEMNTAPRGATGWIVGGAASGDVPFRVTEVVSLSIEEILGRDRHSRLGYELSAPTTTGDSGAGTYDPDGRLVGIVFATSEDGGSTWVTASAEIADFVTTHAAASAAISCDPDASRLELP